MKSDSYLTLCLEQAANSPLHYRHGCIIVRGGKVIGQGYNDYRPGFNGGTLKTGRLPAGSTAGSATTDLKKRKLKARRKDNDGFAPEAKLVTKVTSTKTFTPFEGMGGGVLANTPLSMHSEMMVIHSALSASSTSASSALSSQKPCFKLPRGSKRKARLRREALNIYVETVCKVALARSAAVERDVSVQVQEGRFERAGSQSDQTESCAAAMQRQCDRCDRAQGE
jgi:deoxycytidylate deaminase